MEVAGRANQRGTSGAQPLKGLDAWRIGRHEVCQIKLDGKNFRACFQQFRNLRTTQPTGQAYETSIGLLNDADPAIHEMLRGKTQAIFFSNLWDKRYSP